MNQCSNCNNDFYDIEWLELAPANLQSKTIDITENKTIVVEPDEGYEGFTKLNINTQVVPASSQEKTVNIIKNNETKVILPDMPTYDTLSKLTINTNIPMQEKTVTLTQNNKQTEITADDTYGGLSKAKVNVALPMEDKLVTVTENGKMYTFTPSEGKEGLSSIKVDVQTPSIILEEKTITLDENHKTYTITPSASGKAISKLTANIEIAGLDLQEKTETIEENGQFVYTPDTGKYGLSKITLNVNNQSVPPTNAKLKVLEYDDNGFPKRVLVRDIATLASLFGGNAWGQLTEINIGSGVTTLGRDFINGTKVTELHIPEGVTKLENLCFYNHPQLKKIYMPSTLTSIANSLSYTSQYIVTDIYCAFEEGKFTNAPWGYTNATIHYNYTP